ncbi:MAG: hypothetical protein Q9191_004356 [Dirinaria sp. TL-2023a]
MSFINKVALAGATGNLGPAILDALLSVGFQITVLTRQTSNHNLPSSVAVKKVDYASLDSLTSALQGQDAVVSTLATTSIDQQLLLVEAAAKAGVKRFIPSEFGSDTLHEKTSSLPVFQGKVAVQNGLKEQTKSSGLSYTLVCTGPFLDWGVQVGFLLNIKEKSINLYDGGDRVFSTTTLASIGKAVAGVLQNLDATKNRAVYVQDTAITLKDFLAKGKKAAGSEGWKEEVVAVDDLLAKAWEELKKENPNPDAFVYNFIIASIWGEGYGSHFQKLDNDLLDIKQLNDDELQAIVSKYA